MKKCTNCGSENDDVAVQCRECKSLFTGEGSSETAKPPKFQFGTLSEQDKTKDLVTLLNCRTLADADLIKSVLQGAGIRVFIPDEFLIQAVSFPGIYGYVRVQISPSHYEAAKAILNSIE